MAVGLGLRIDQSVDLLGDFRVVVFGPVSSAGVEVVEAADTGAEFAKTGPDSVASPTEDFLGTSRLAVTVLEGYLGLKLSAGKACQFAGGRANDFLHRGRQVGLHDRVLVLEESQTSCSGRCDTKSR